MNICVVRERRLPGGLAGGRRRGHRWTRRHGDLRRSRTLACLVLHLWLVRFLAHLLVLHHRPVRSRTRWSLRGLPPGSWDRCRSLQGTSRSHLRSGDRCGGRLRPGWPSPGGRHKRRSSPDLLHSCAVGKRRWAWRRCRPGADQSGQTLAYAR